MKILCYFTFIVGLVFTGCNNNDNSGTDPEIPSELEDCLITTSDQNLEIMTWNLQEFPLDGEETITETTQIIKELNPDLIALQEISNDVSLDALTSNLVGWEYQIEISSGMNLAFLIKTSEVTVDEDISEILTGDSYAFPRPPVQMKISHSGGLSAVLINIHLKCCGGQENIWRRKDASEQLKAYIDSNYADEEVILLGDYNNEISDVFSEENVFFNFIEDDQDYQFVDMDIALGSNTGWSYPSWPSHIDHIMITDELFDNVIGTNVLSIDDCYDQYLYDVTDHRPVILQLSQD